MSPTEKTLKLLLLILRNQYKFKLSQLADKIDVSPSTVKRYIKAIRDAKINVDIEKNRYAILPDEDAPELTKLFPLSDHDLTMINTSLKDGTKVQDIREAEYLMKKLESLVDIQKMGLRALQSAQLEKMNVLEQSKAEKKQVRLINYRSNSSGTQDRVVECFDVDADSGTIQVFDLTRMLVRHFKISRIERVELLPISWQYEDKQFQKKIDDFRIANNNQVSVRLKINQFAYNVLYDTFPKAARKAIKANEEHFFNLDIRVNEDFYGLIPFILGNPGRIEIIEPYILKRAVADKARIFLLG